MKGYQFFFWPENAVFCEKKLQKYVVSKLDKFTSQVYSSISLRGSWLVQEEPIISPLSSTFAHSVLKVLIILLKGAGK